MRPQRLDGLRPRRRSGGHVPQVEDRDAGAPAAPRVRRGEQDVRVLHADGAVADVAAEFAGAAPGRDSHQHDRARAAADAGRDPAEADRARAGADSRRGAH